MKIKKTKELFLSCNVAGFSHYEGCIVFDQLKIGSQLQLVREDENAYDHDAVAIFFGDSHLGYVPSSKNEQLATMLDLGHSDLFEAYVQRLDPTAHPEQQVHVAIDPVTGDRAILVAQSYMPAQDIHIISATNDNPWFFVKDFLTAEYIDLRSWGFQLHQIQSFEK